MATPIAYWRGSTRRRLLRGLAGSAVFALPLVWLALNPSFAVRLLEWGMSRGAGSATSAASEVPSSVATAKVAPVESGGIVRVAAGTNNSGATGVLHPAIAASIGVPRSAGSDAGQSHGVSPATDDHNLELLRRVCDLLKSGRERFAQIPAYRATLCKRERVGDDLTQPTTLDVKVRHQPFAVYLKWLEGKGVGKEVLYVDGENDGNMLVRLGGVKGRLIPAFKLDPAGALAMNESRYPITKVGILGLTESLITHREQELQNQVYARAHQGADADCDGRRCAVYVFEFDDRERSTDYRKSVQYLDRTWNVPLLVENYGWSDPGEHLAGAALDEATLIEYYKYSNVVTEGTLNGDDFSPSNPEYRFRR